MSSQTSHPEIPITPAAAFPAATLRMLELAGELAVSERRSDAARKLAQAFGAKDLLVFLVDDEVGAMLSAPGFRQTLPGGREWQQFLKAVGEQKRYSAELKIEPGGRRARVDGWGGSEAVIALVGASATQDMEWMRVLLPLLDAALGSERKLAIADARMESSRGAAVRAEALASTLDVTRRQLEDAMLSMRQTQAELERVNSQLQDQALELELQADEQRNHNIALEEARGIAESANRAKSEFLATMSHELRTPLNAIGGHVELLEMGLHGPVTSAQDQSLARIKRSQRHLLGLINNLLSLSRIEAGKVDYRISEVSVNEAICDLAPMIEPQLAVRNLAYESRIPDDVIVKADREKLEQIVLNLLSNAVKFTDVGGRVWIDTTRRNERGMTEINVSDTGRGIPADKLEAVFEPFTQVDASHSRVAEGTGLGLAISRDLARGMGGDLTVRSTPGSGSTFSLVLCPAETQA